MGCPSTLGVILAGGLARRMGGGDKPLLALQGRPLLMHAASRLAPQCESLILNANGNPERFGTLDFPVAPDTVGEQLGPLAGILAALEWAAAHQPSLAWVVSVPGDTPFIPVDLVARLHEARHAARRPLACAASGSRTHFAVGLWPVHLRYDLRQALTSEGLRSIRSWLELHGYTEAAWSVDPVDPFFNVNTPEDLAHAHALVEEEAGRA
jgi:molybdopterin-guanine dinucleotide biosynthesis protein A